MKLNELFTIQYGSNLELSNVEETDISQGIPFVSRTEKNCGVSAYVVKQPNSVKINPKHTLSVALGGTVLATFYQEEDYYSGYHIGVLIPKFEMSKEEMIYYALCIRANKLKYSYGRQANRTLKDIELPDYDKIPKWINSYKSGNVEIIKTINKDSVVLENFNDFNLCDLFDVVRGKSKPISEMTLDMGNIPIISSTGLDNGVTGYTSFPANFNLNNNEVCLTLAIDGSIGSCFYQNEPFIATGHVAVLKPKFTLNKYIAVYIGTLLKKEGKLKYSFGRAWDLDLLKKTQLKLPSKDGEIDWKSIENYIKNIENKYKINEISINDK